MIPSVNFNPSIANLTALHGLGGIPHPLQPVAPISVGGPMRPPVMPIQPPTSPIHGPVSGPMPFDPYRPGPVMGGNYGFNQQPQMPQGINNLEALRRMFSGGIY